MEDDIKRKEKQIYIKSIIKSLEVCDDLELLDLIFQLLKKNHRMR